MTGLAALVFALGLRHGFDPDHLVAIDGLTRSSKSRWCGLFFSLGHGVAVTLIGVAVAIAATEWQAPSWLEQSGAAISIGVLLVLGVLNLLAVLRTPAGSRVALIGLRGRWLSERLAGTSHPAVIASIGAAFAVSFDTVSHALAFSLTGATMAGALFAAVLGIVFTAGMVLTDAINGLWVAKMMSGAAIASRWMSGVVAFLCLSMGVLAVSEYALPASVLSAGTIALISIVGLVAMLRSRSACREAGS
jgi:nickel/cobalt transporter (NiCoT) family protein